MEVLLEYLEAFVRGDDMVAERMPSDEAATAVEAKPDVSEPVAPVEVNPVKEQTINYQAQTLVFIYLTHHG